MSDRDRFGGMLLLTGALLLGSWVARAQTSSPTVPLPSCAPVRDAQGNLVVPSNCSSTTSSPAAAQRFPFPGEATPATESPDAASPQSPATPQPAANSQAPAGKRFPFPGEEDAPASSSSGQGSGSGEPPLQDAGSSGEAASSSSSSSSSAKQDEAEDGKKADDPDANDPATIPRSKRHKLPPVPRQSPSEREQEDVQVAGFYFNDGNFRGSYDRARDAVSLDEEDAAAHFALGNAARKLGKLDEAEKAYRRCLELDPVPKLRKPAEKALHEMAGN